MINNHKAPIKLKDPSNKISDDNSYGEWKIQLTLQISFIFFQTQGKFVQWIQRVKTQKL